MSLTSETLTEIYVLEEQLGIGDWVLIVRTNGWIIGDATPLDDRCSLLHELIDLAGLMPYYRSKITVTVMFVWVSDVRPGLPTLDEVDVLPEQDDVQHPEQDPNGGGAEEKSVDVGHHPLLSALRSSRASSASN